MGGSGEGRELEFAAGEEVEEDVGFVVDFVDDALHPAEDVVFGFVMPEARWFEAGLGEKELQGLGAEVMEMAGNVEG